MNIGPLPVSTYRRPGEVGRALLALTKPRIVELLLITTIPTMFLASRGLPQPGRMVVTVAGGALAAGGANALNMVYDRDVDARMARTKNRPLVTGALTPTTALLFALALELTSFVLLWQLVNVLAAALTLGAAAFYVLVYTAWLKRSTPQNIVIGGLAGAAPALVAWAAVTDHLAPTAYGLFAVVALWTPPHFWALAMRYRDDYAAADIPMLPAVTDARRVTRNILGYTVALVATSLAITAFGRLGFVYLLAAAVLGIGFVMRAVRLHYEPTSARAMALFGYSIFYLATLFVFVGLGTVLP